MLPKSAHFVAFRGSKNGLKMGLDGQLDSHLGGHGGICNYPFKVRKNAKNSFFEPKTPPLIPKSHPLK